MSRFQHESQHVKIVNYLKDLRDDIVRQFEKFESGVSFERKSWTHNSGEGGGEISLIRGKVFEKAAVNWSGVTGTSLDMPDVQGPFYATGLSLITHMANPKAPTVHFNIRYIETTQKHWWGGGFDLTPMGFAFSEDTQHFHSVAEEILAPFGKGIYKTFSEQARKYFTIQHYGRERGVGGIFFDHYNTGDFQKDWALWKAVGDHFLDTILPIYKRRINEPFTAEDRQLQLQKRGHYVEFNLLYDRGTQFGFRSGGNPEAILCSMPPLAAW